MNALCPTELFAMTKDIVLMVVAVIGSIVAVRGLRTWNRQLKGGVEYELTRRLLKQTYRLREAIHAVRNPFMSAAEMPAPPEDERSKMSVDQALHYGSVRGYERRWEPVVATRNELQADLLEAEVLWGKEVHAKFQPLFELQGELFSNLHTYLRASDPKQNEKTRDALHALLAKRREVLYDLSDVSDPESDDFSQNISIVISQIELFLKPHLKK